MVLIKGEPISGLRKLAGVKKSQSSCMLFLIWGFTYTKQKPRNLPEGEVSSGQLSQVTETEDYPFVLILHGCCNKFKGLEKQFYCLTVLEIKHMLQISLG